MPGQAAKSKLSDPDTFWSNYYQKHDETPEQLRETVRLLNHHKKFPDVQAVLTGYLKYHGKNAEPWMYSALALAIRMRKGSEADVKQALGYAADLAARGRNPNDLVSVADQMLVLNELGRVGPLLDQAAALVPHRGEPILMSIQLAQKTHDPARMADSADRLLSLGWPGDPGFDERIRREARKEVETLARALREDGKPDESDQLLQRLTASEARDLFLRLTWTGDADLDLAVEDPKHYTTRVSTPRTVAGGSIIKNGYGSHPEEVYVCPRGFSGAYTVRIETIYNNKDKPALSATLEVITHEGTAQEKKETRTIPLALDRAPAPQTVTLEGGRRTAVLPIIPPTVPTLPKPKAKPGRTPAAAPAAPASAAAPGARPAGPTR